MKRFQFSLQAIQSQRQHKEELARERYAGALRACEQAARNMQTASYEEAAAWAALNHQLEAGLNSDDLLQARAWCHALELHVAECGAHLRKTEEKATLSWQALLLATREREALDRFHQKRRVAHHRCAQKEEQKLLDEVAIQRAGRARALAEASRHARL